MSGSSTRTRSEGSPATGGRWGSASSLAIAAGAVGVGSRAADGSGAVTEGSGSAGTGGCGTGSAGTRLVGPGAGFAEGFGAGRCTGAVAVEAGRGVPEADGDGFAEALGVGWAPGEAAARGAGVAAYAKPEPSGVAEPVPAAGRAAGRALIGTHGHAAAVRVGDGQHRADVRVGVVVAQHRAVGRTRLTQVGAARAQQHAGARDGIGEALRVGDPVAVAVAPREPPDVGMNCIGPTARS